MSDAAQIPLALRRERRHAQKAAADDGPKSGATTPSRRKQKPRKRVRFSDPGPVIANLEDELSTGLTPMVRRTTLLPKSSRRHSTPAGLSRLQSQEDDTDDPISPSTQIHFLPLRQVLDGRVKRRLRRNGLSEEMNVIYSERRKKAQETQDEISRLKKELAEKDEEIRNFHDQTIEYDTERVWELEQQIEALKDQLASRSGVRQAMTPSSPSCHWTMAARDPFSDDFMELDTDDVEDDVFGDTTMADLACSTPSRRARDSFPTPPSTSPPLAPRTPSSRTPTSRRLPSPVTPFFDAGVQAALPDPEKRKMEEDLASLQLEVGRLTSTLETYTSLASRLSAKLSPYQPLATGEEPHSDIHDRLAMVLQTLSDRTAVLLDLSKSLSSLGFPGSDASEIVTSLSSTFRTARLELEYLAPGEVTLPLNSAGAAVFDLILDRLRDLAKRNREADDTIDEYHAIELSLRQQLSARVDAMGILDKQLKHMDTEVQERDSRIIELEVALERVKSAVDRYTRDVSELEALVQQMETELEATNDERLKDQEAHDKAVQKHQEDMEQKTSTITDLEAKLRRAVEQISSLQTQLAEMQDAHAKALEDMRSKSKAEAAKMTKASGQALALRDARVAELRLEIDRIQQSLRATHDTIKQKRIENHGLKELNDKLTADNVELGSKREMDKRKAKEVVDSLKAELERVVQMGEGFLAETPKKPRRSSGLDRESALGDGEARLSSGSLLSGELAKRGKKRRRYDSGLGFLDEDDVE